MLTTTPSRVRWSAWLEAQSLSISAVGQPAGASIYNSARRTEAASSFFARSDTRFIPFPRLRKMLAAPAQFFFCPHRSTRFRHAENCRGLRLLWLLHCNQQLRRMA